MDNDYLIREMRGYFLDERDGTRVVEHTFLKPAVLTIRKPDGTIEKIGYGIGEKVFKIEPNMQSLVGTYGTLTEIPLEDGSFIVEWPDDLNTSRAW